MSFARLARIVRSTLVVVALACSTHTQAAADPGKVLRVAFPVAETGFDPQASIDLYSDSVQRAIFEPFKQADISTSRRYGGTGLGLSISRKLVELMGGTLEVASEANKGSEFSFSLTLPVVARETGVPQIRQSLRDVKVLVVDDHSTNRRVITEMLSWGGCLPGEATNADEGLQAEARARRVLAPVGEAAGEGGAEAEGVLGFGQPGQAAIRGEASPIEGRFERDSGAGGEHVRRCGKMGHERGLRGRSGLSNSTITAGAFSFQPPRE